MSDTLDELSYLVKNGNITSCLLQTWCYYNKYNNNDGSNLSNQFPTDHLENRYVYQFHILISIHGLIIFVGLTQELQEMGEN